MRKNLFTLPEGSTITKFPSSISLTEAACAAGALAALDDTAHAEKTRRVNARGLKLYARAFRKLGLEFIPSFANFILVRVGDGQRVFSELQKLGVIVRPMGGYQLPEWIRISIGTSKENQRCLEALKSVIAPPVAPVAA